MKMVMTKLVILEKPRAHAIGMEKQLYIMQQGVVISRFASFFLAMFKRKIQKMSMGRLQLIMHLSTDIWISCIFVNSYQRPFAQKGNENKTRDFWRPKFEKCFRQTIWISRTTSTSESWVSSKTSYPCATCSSTSWPKLWLCICQRTFESLSYLWTHTRDHLPKKEMKTKPQTFED